MKALVTGIAGFTGSYLADALAASGATVVGISQTEAQLANVERVHVADIDDVDALRELVRSEQPDLVAHLAAISSVDHGDVDELYRTNLTGSRNLLEALAGAPRPPRAILLASSANIYGNSRAGVLDESLPPEPANDYAVSKIAMEFLAPVYRDRLPLIIARPFNYTGRGQSERFLIPKIVAHAKKKAPVIELGNIDVARDFSDVRMVADAYVRLLTTDAAIGGTFNICSGRAVTLREILDRVEKLSGHYMEVRVNPAFVRANEVRSLLGSSQRVEEAIGPLRTIALGETLRWMLDDACE